MFARKLVRIIQLEETEDVKNEIRAITKLCNGSQENVVKVLRHGRLHNSPFYFFDMELCDSNLQHYKKLLWNPQTALATDWDSRIMKIWTVMSDIACGLAYIHQQREIHRDLKPSNSMSLGAMSILIK